MPRRISLSVRQTFQQADAVSLNHNHILPKKPSKAVSLKYFGRWFGGISSSQKNELETEHKTILLINSNHSSTHKKPRGPTPAHKRYQLRKQREERKNEIVRNAQDDDNNNNNSFGEDDTISTVDTVKQTNCHHRRNSHETTTTTSITTKTNRKQKQKRNLKKRIRKRSASDKKEQAKQTHPPSVLKILAQIDLDLT